MPKLGDRVKDTSTTTGTGAFTLTGTAPAGFVNFNYEFGLNTVFNYVIDDGAGNFEVGRGYLSGTTTLVRDTVLDSSNADSLVNFGAGTKTVFCDAPDEYLERASFGRMMQKGFANFSF